MSGENWIACYWSVSSSSEENIGTKLDNNVYVCVCRVFSKHQPSGEIQCVRVLVCIYSVLHLSSL